MGWQDKYIDRWPAWLIAIYACLTIGLHNGLLNCGALFYPSLMDSFGHPISVVSWLVTGQYAVTYCLSPLYNRLIDFVSNRIAITCAVLLTTGSVTAASMVGNFWGFLLLYTIIGGFGMGISVVRAVSIAVEYFDRYRILALALCSSGTGLGTFVYSKIGAYMIDTYTWRVALIGFALLHLHMIPIGLVLKPLPEHPIPEPTVLIPDQPDLNACDAVPDTVDRKLESNQNLFLSIMSVNSVHGNSAGRIPIARSRMDVNKPSTIVSDLRVVIEFVKATRCPGTQPVVCLDTITFLPDPGARLLKQLEDAAQDVLFEESAPKDQVLIPILFLMSDFDIIQIDAHDPLSGSQLKFFLDSRFDMQELNDKRDEGGAIPKQSYPMPVGDAFTSSMAVLQERRRVRQTIRAVIAKSQQKVKQLSAELMERGLSVYPNPLIALVDQSVDDTGPVKPSAEHNYMWSNLALDRYIIPEENEPLEHVVDETASGHNLAAESNQAARALELPGGPEIDRSQMMQKRSHLGASQLIGSRPTLWTGRIRRSGSVTRPFDSVLIQSGTEISRSKVSAAQTRDIFASVLSIANPKEAATVLEEKYLDDWKAPIVTVTGDAIEPTGVKRCILTDMAFFSFLLTRSLVFIADSIVFAHLTNFAIGAGFDPELAAGLLSFIGIANMFGRVGTGVIGQFAPRMELRCLTAGCLVILAVYTVVMPLFPTYVALACFAVIYGLLVSPSFAFAPAIAYDLVGPGRYDEAIAFVYQFEATGYLIGGPIGGAIKEIRDNYFDCFAFCGSNDLIASLILFMQAFLVHDLGTKLLRCFTRRGVRDEK